ncbi:cytochrome b/b6 domain-containing protein [Chitinibacteraceae bacterium HSL-7]
MIQVWDRVVRVVHWTLVSVVLANLLFTESGAPLHRWAGYLGLSAVLLRVIWGLVGSPYARFSQWWPAPRRVLPYLRAFRQPPRMLGHNPLGALMMLSLLLLVASLGVTGWMMGLDAYWGEAWLESLHGTLADILAVLVMLHVAGALLESWRHRENLIAAMWHGRKRPLDES